MPIPTAASAPTPPTIHGHLGLTPCEGATLGANWVPGTGPVLITVGGKTNGPRGTGAPGGWVASKLGGGGVVTWRVPAVGASCGGGATCGWVNGAGLRVIGGGGRVLLGIAAVADVVVWINIDGISCVDVVGASRG